MNQHAFAGCVLLRRLCYAAGILGLLCCIPASAATYTVHTTADFGPGSLRQAIQDANADPGPYPMIEFDLAPNAVISPASPLPSISGGTVLKSTVPVTIDGSALGGASIGLSVNTSSNGSAAVVIDGLTLQNFGSGIEAYSPVAVGNCRFLDCAIGVSLQEHSGSIIGLPSTEIPLTEEPPPPPAFGSGGNLFQRCSSIAVYAAYGGHHVIQGNLIGTTADGMDSAGAGQGAGIRVDLCGGCQIGGNFLGTGNLIAGLTGTGIDLENSPKEAGCRVQSNYIGCTRLGDAALPMGTIGINVAFCPANLIQRNVVTANGINQTGIVVTGFDASNNTLIENRVGLDPTGQIPLGSLGNGILVANGANNVVGLPYQGNMIGPVGSRQLTFASGSNLTVQGNIVATNRTGQFFGTASNGCIVTSVINGLFGGSGPGEGNTIVGIGGPALLITGSNSTVYLTGNTLIQPGSGVALDLFGAAGVNANDTGDGDSGPNGLQNYPVITNVSYTNGLVTVQGTLNSRPNLSYTIELFASNAGAGSSRQAQQPLGTVMVTTDAGGNASFNFTKNTPLTSDPTGQASFTATATGPTGTSELSAPVSIVVGPPPMVDYGAYAYNTRGGIFTPNSKFEVYVRGEITSSAIGPPYPGAITTVTVPPGFEILDVVPIAGTTVEFDGQTVTLTSASGPPAAVFKLRVNTEVPGIQTIDVTVIPSLPDSAPQDNNYKLPIGIVNNSPGLVQYNSSPLGLALFSKVGRRYRVEYSTDLVHWYTVDDNVVGTGNVINYPNPPPPGKKKFFRVIELD